MEARQDEFLRAHPPLDSKINLFEHQRQGYNFSLDHLFKSPVRVPFGRGVALLMEQGCGKTLTAAAAVGALFRSGRATRIIVLAPKTVTPVWRDELMHVQTDRGPVRIFDAVGSSSFREKTFAMAAKPENGVYPPTAVLINYDSVWRKCGDKIPALLFNPDIAILDEGHKIKDHTAAVSKFSKILGEKTPYRMLLTGTAITNTPMDVFSEYRFVDPSLFGTNFYVFRNRYFENIGYVYPKYVLKESMREDFTQKIMSVSFRVTKAECLDLPEKTDEIRDVVLEPDALKLYQQLVKESYSDLVAGGISANNVLTRMLRLSQLTGGFLKGDEAECTQSVSTAKLDALRDILLEAQASAQKVVVIARFTAEINAIRKLCEEMKLGYSTIAGDTKDRAAMVKAFQEDPNTTVFVGQIVACCTGITLHAAHLMVFYSMDYSMANFEQCRDRIHRIGMDTTQPCHYIYLCAKGTVDKKVLASVREKRDLAKSLVDDARNGINPYLD